MSSYIDFYHYTSGYGKSAIIDCGYIKENSPGGSHAHFGGGVYGTGLPPSTGKYKIARNNWQRHAGNYIRSGACSWAIKLKIPSDKVKKIGRIRDILLYKDRLYLKDYEYETIKV